MKKLVYLSLLAVSVGALAGCGSRNDPKTIVVSGPASERGFLEAQVQKFFDAKKAADSSFDYSFTMVDHGEDKVDSEVTDWTSATAPDVYAFASDKTLGLNNKGALATVPQANITYFEQNLDAKAIESAKSSTGDAVLGYPFTTANGYFAYVNVGALRSNGVADDSWQNWTMEDWISFSERTALKFAYNLPEAFYGAAALTSAGAKWNVTFNRQGVATNIEADFDGPNGLKAAEDFFKVVKSTSYSVTQGAANMENYSFIVDGAWNASTYYGIKPGTNANDKIANYDNTNITTAKIPTFADGIHPRSFIGTKLYGVNPQKFSGDATRLGIMHELAIYLITPEIQEIRFDQLSYAPSDKSIAALAKVTANPLVRALSEQSADGLIQANLPTNVWNGSKPFFEGLAQLPSWNEAQVNALLKTYNDLMKNTTDQSASQS